MGDFVAGEVADVFGVVFKGAVDEVEDVGAGDFFEENAGVVASEGQAAEIGVAHGGGGAVEMQSD